MNNNKHNKFTFLNSGKENSFLTPDGYFEGLNKKVHLRINKEINNPQAKNERGRWTAIRSQLALAAGFIGFAFIIYSGVHFFLGRESQKDLYNNYLTEFIELEYSNISEEILFEMIESSRLKNEEENNNMNELIIEYLSDSKIDYESIIKEL